MYFCDCVYYCLRLHRGLVRDVVIGYLVNITTEICQRSGSCSCEWLTGRSLMFHILSHQHQWYRTSGSDQTSLLPKKKPDQELNILLTNLVFD